MGHHREKWYFMCFLLLQAFKGTEAFVCPTMHGSRARRSLATQPNTTAEAELTAVSAGITAALHVGQRVKARYMASQKGPPALTKWFRGQVSAIANAAGLGVVYSIQYDDGDVEESVLPNFVKPENAAVQEATLAQASSSQLTDNSLNEVEPVSLQTEVPVESSSWDACTTAKSQASADERMDASRVASSTQASRQRMCGTPGCIMLAYHDGLCITEVSHAKHAPPMRMLTRKHHSANHACASATQVPEQIWAHAGEGSRKRAPPEDATAAVDTAAANAAAVDTVAADVAAVDAAAANAASVDTAAANAAAVDTAAADTAAANAASVDTGPASVLLEGEVVHSSSRTIMVRRSKRCEVLDAIDYSEQTLTGAEASLEEESAKDDEMRELCSSSKEEEEASSSGDEGSSARKTSPHDARRPMRTKKGKNKRWSLEEARRLKALFEEAKQAGELRHSGTRAVVWQRIVRDLGTGRSVNCISQLSHKMDALIEQCAAREKDDVEIVDGVELIKSKRSVSGYKHVDMCAGKFMVRVINNDGRREVLGIFDSAIEGAKRYALYRQGPELARRASTEDLQAFTRMNEEEVERRGLVREAAGLPLLLSPFARSGYRYVHLDPTDSFKPWNVQLEIGGAKNASKNLGHFATAVDAAVAVATYAASHCDEVWHAQRRGQYPRVSQSVGAEVDTARARALEPLVFKKRERVYTKRVASEEKKSKRGEEVEAYKKRKAKRPREPRAVGASGAGPSSGLEAERRAGAALKDAAKRAKESAAPQTIPPRVTCGMGDCTLPAYHLGLCLVPPPVGRIRTSSVAPGPPRVHAPLCAEGSCQICFEDAAEADGRQSGRTTHCGHLYHVECLEQWLREKAECPVCRAPLFSRRRMWLDACSVV